MPDGRLIAAETCRNVIYSKIAINTLVIVPLILFFNFCFTVANIIIVVVNIYRDASHFFAVAFEL